MTGPEQLFISFEKLLLTNKIENISITKICKEGNINRNTFYYHYNSLNEFIEGYYLYSFGDSIKEKIQNKQFNEAYFELMDYCINKRKIFINLLNLNTMNIFGTLFHENIRLVIADVLIDYSKMLNIPIKNDFIAFFSHNIAEEYIACFKQLIFESVNPNLLRTVFPIYIENIPAKLIKVSKLNWE